MTNSVGMQYASAIFDLAYEKKCVTDYYQALDVINTVIKDEDISKVFMHPSITLDAKKEILKKSISTEIDETLLNFLYVLLDNNRLFDLPLIVVAYKELLNKYENVIEVDLYYKYPLTDEQRVEIKDKLSNYYQKKVVLHEILDDSLIGGIKITTAGEVLDVSVLSSLSNLKNSLKKGW